MANVKVAHPSITAPFEPQSATPSFDGAGNRRPDDRRSGEPYHPISQSVGPPGGNGRPGRRRRVRWPCNAAGRKGGGNHCHEHVLRSVEAADGPFGPKPGTAPPVADVDLQVWRRVLDTAPREGESRVERPSGPEQRLVEARQRWSSSARSDESCNLRTSSTPCGARVGRLRPGPPNHPAVEELSAPPKATG